jgi:hypothetical protein
MPVHKVKLVDLPKPLRQGIDRRLPRTTKTRDLTGKRFPRGVVLGFAGFKGPYSAWLVLCSSCRRILVIEAGRLAYEDTSGCGCGRTRITDAARALYHVYKHMLRCRRSVCKRWRQSIENFAADVGPRPSRQHVLVRRNLKRGYMPSNCRWGTRIDSQRKRQGARMITARGKTQSMSRWAAELGITRATLWERLRKCEIRGHSLATAISGNHKRGRPRKTDK